jgi:hypothetical protein
VILHEWVARGAHASFSRVITLCRFGDQHCLLGHVRLAKGAPAHGRVCDTFISVIAALEVLYVGEPCSTHASVPCVIALADIGYRKAVQAPFVCGSVRLLHAPVRVLVATFCKLDQGLARLSSAALAILGALEPLPAD